MTAINAGSNRRFYRDKDRAILGGVCAGLAEYLGFNLKVTRFLAFIAFLTAMPIAVVAYLAAVFLIPSESHGHQDAAIETRCQKRKRRKSKREQHHVEPPKSPIADEINRRCETLDERLRRLEKHVTSKRYQLEQELSRL